MQIERRNDLSPESFSEGYLATSTPVIAIGAMDRWRAVTRWTPAFLRREFGEFEAQVYNDLFDLVNVTTLAEYLDENFDQPGDSPSREYVRWYSRLKDLDFAWSDEVFDRLKDDWEHPDFLPGSSYVVPFCPAPRRIRVTDSRFPYRGIFISGRGARTRLHRDPWTSEAILCQLHGEKRVILYAPDQAERLTRDGEFVDPEDPDLDRFPSFPEARPSFVDTLRPGEILYLPSGWFHDVTSISDSISVTWNFVHRARAAALSDHIRRNPLDAELEIVRFFLSPWLPPGAGASQIIAFLERPAEGPEPV